MATKTEVKLFIRNCSPDDLDDLVQAVSARRTVLNGEAAFKFPVGSKVKFDSGRRGIVTGTIEGWARGGRANVRSTYGQAWRVAGSLLREVSDPKPPPREVALPGVGDAGGDEF